MYELTLCLDNKSGTPLYEQIYTYIKNEIKNGKIECKSRLPSTRSLAEHLQISRSTVDMAYTQLLSEGYIESVPCKGYYVCEISLLHDISIAQYETDGAEEEDGTDNLIDFTPYGVDLEYFPFNIWRKITKNVLNEENKDMFDIGNPMGDIVFRRTICNYLFEARNVHCRPEQILIGAGNHYLLTILCRLFNSEKTIAMESPTYQKAYHIFKTNNCPVVTVNVEKDGIDVKDVISKNADVVYVMPSHHYPLGTVMSIGKRTELIKWANENEERYIIEDDYDSEFRYHGKTIPALKGIQCNADIIYIGTFSKSIASAIRMSYMVLPEKLLERYKQNMHFYSQTVSRIDQTVVNEFISRGYFERHLNKMRSVYREKHDLIIACLKDMGDMIQISGENAGLHLLLNVNNKMSEDELIKSAKEQGVKVYGLSDNFIEGANADRQAIILGFAQINKNLIAEGINLLKKAWFDVERKDEK